MRILLVPANTGKTRNIDLTSVKYIAGCTAAVVLAIGVGIGWLVKPTSDSQRSIAAYMEEIRDIGYEFSREKQEIYDSAKSADSGITSLGKRIGRLQAELERVMAVEERLVQVSGLDSEVFNEDAPVGGDEAPLNEKALDAENFPANDLDAEIVVAYAGSLADFEQKLSKRMDRLTVLENRIRKEKQLELTVPSAWPTTGGYITSRFGKRIDPFTGKYRYHRGVDIANSKGSSILSSADGVVVTAEYDRVKGNVVAVDHGHGYKSWYFHMSDISVVVGDTVKEGDQLGIIGSTGRSTGVHLHFELRRDGIAINPAPYIGYKPKA